MPHGISFFKYKSLRCVMDSFLQKKGTKRKERGGMGVACRTRKIREVFF
jgi:hypothetical protein